MPAELPPPDGLLLFARYGADGAKERYFRDDDTKTLDDLVKEQRYEGVQDMDRNLAQNITRKAKYKVAGRLDSVWLSLEFLLSWNRFGCWPEAGLATQGKELDVDDEYDHDGGVEMYEDRRKKGSKEKQNQRSKAAQVADYKRMQSAQDRCMFCFGGQVRLAPCLRPRCPFHPSTPHLLLLSAFCSPLWMNSHLLHRLFTREPNLHFSSVAATTLQKPPAAMMQQAISRHSTRAISEDQTRRRGAMAAVGPVHFRRGRAGGLRWPLG